MKIGVEAEGRLRGVQTLFVDAIDVIYNLAKVKAALKDNAISHIYVSDRNNTLDYSFLGQHLEGYLITLDVTAVTPRPRPTNVTIILTMPYEYWQSVQMLRFTDQIKFHSEDRNVLCAAVQSFVATQPIEFAGDIELS
jgi:hypothetical protein